MKTSELTRDALNWAVAHAQGAGAALVLTHSHGQALILSDHTEDCDIGEHYQPSINWAQGGPIIERERLAVWFSEAVHDENGNVLRDACWYSETSCTTDNGDSPYKCETGDTPLVAAMRCFVASKLGDEIDIDLGD